MSTTEIVIAYIGLGVTIAAIIDFSDTEREAVRWIFIPIFWLPMFVIVFLWIAIDVITGRLE